MDNGCNLNNDCPAAGIHYQPPEEYNNCKIPQAAPEEVDGCKYLEPSLFNDTRVNWAVGLQELPLGGAIVKA